MGISGEKEIIYKIEKIIGLDLIIVVVLASLLLIFALALPDGNILRIVFGLPFLLFLPGYSLVSALWTKKSELGMLERIGFSLGLSIAMVPLVGLGLNYTPAGITLISVVSSLYLSIIILVGITWFRRSKLAPEERFVIRQDFIFLKAGSTSPTDSIMILLAVIVVVIGAGIMAYIVMNPPSERYSELYILDENGTTGNYPSSLSVNESTSIIINVVCKEQQTMDYEIIIILEPDGGSNRTLAQYDFTLDDDAQWEQDFDFNISESGTFKLNIKLFKENEPDPYANNHIWLDVRN